MKPIFFGLALALGLGGAGAAQAEPLDETGYFTGCFLDDASGADVCEVVASGFRFYASPDGGSDPAVMQALMDLPMLSAVTITGEILSMGDLTAEVRLQSVTPVADDLLQGTVQAIQGDWRPEGEETPFYITINGLDWTEMQDEPLASYLISAGTTCADGVEPGGPALVLYEMGGSPDAAACWQVEYVDDKTLQLRDFMGDQGQVVFTRP